MSRGGSGEIEVTVESVRVHMPTGRHVLVLREADQGRLLMIWVGPWEASAIAMKLQGLTPERPLTHDLLVTVLQELDAAVARIVISDLADETFHARLVIDRGAGPIDIDARPSDAIALAVRLGAPIFATEDVLDRAATVPDTGDDESADDDASDEGRARRGAASSLESTGEKIDATRLDIFREFVNSLDEGEGRGSGGSSGPASG
jgi:bifunctional DNase/RNase